MEFNSNELEDNTKKNFNVNIILKNSRKLKRIQEQSTTQKKFILKSTKKKQFSTV